MKVAVWAESEDRRSVAEDLAGRFGLEVAGLGSEHHSVGSNPEESSRELLLVSTPNRLELREPGVPGALWVEFRTGRGSPLLRRATLAARGEELRVVDATAGLGQDAFALAEWGCRVEMIERSPVVAALLDDGLQRARRAPDLGSIAERLTLRHGDALELLPASVADIVYLDPMYPRSGREARKAKGMRLLRQLLGGDEDADSLLVLARKAASRRVVVKRPLRAPVLAGGRPSGSVSGLTVRYDLYAPMASGG